MNDNSAGADQKKKLFTNAKKQKSSSSLSANAKDSSQVLLHAAPTVARRSREEALAVAPTARTAAAQVCHFCFDTLLLLAVAAVREMQTKKNHDPAGSVSEKFSPVCLPDECDKNQCFSTTLFSNDFLLISIRLLSVRSFARRRTPSGD